MKRPFTPPALPAQRSSRQPDAQFTAPAVFISHGVGCPAAQTTLTEIETWLLKEGFDVLLDRSRLNEAAGKRWRDALNEWMAMCDSAVIVIDERALESDWVRNEASVLAWRSSRDKTFLLIPIIVPPVRPADLKGLGFGPADIANLQSLRVSEDAANRAPQTPETLAHPPELVQELLACLGPLKDALNFARRRDGAFWAQNQIVKDLRNLADETIEEMVFEMGGENLRWHPTIDKRQQVARLILGAGLSNFINMPTVQGSMPRDVRMNIVNILGMGWIDRRAVAELWQITSETAGQRAAAINTDWQQVPRWYVQHKRFGGGSSLIFHIDLDDEYPTPEDAREAVVEQVKKELEVRLPRGERRRELNRLMGEHYCDRSPLFFLLCGDEPLAAELDEIRRTFPSVTLIVLADPDVAGRTQANCGARLVRPELRKEQIEEIRDDWNMAYTYLNTSGGGA